mmetsp:Transcript_50978/g.110780  ORF Transcript_50978/g.110780 Transcript_50978/m.110780 type:complete len:100 (-) Transcript_50978:1480-1779(-)
MLKALLTYNPAKRIIASDCVEHPYFSDHPVAKDPQMMPTFPEFHGGRGKRRSPPAGGEGRAVKAPRQVCDVGEGGDESTGWWERQGWLGPTMTHCTVSA